MALGAGIQRAGGDIGVTKEEQREPFKAENVPVEDEAGKISQSK